MDGIVGAFYLTMDRAERMDYSSFTWVDGFSLVIPNPGEESRLFAFVRPFQPWVNCHLSSNFPYLITTSLFQVWMSIFLSLSLVVSTMTFYTWFYNRGRPNKISIEVTSVKTNSQSKMFHQEATLLFFLAPT